MKRLSLFITLLLVPVAMADVVHLKDGSKVEGDVKKRPDGYVVITREGKYFRLKPDDVKSIELSTPVKVDDKVAAERLASLRRSVEYVPDVHQIIERYQRYIEQNLGSPSEKEARLDLAVWQDRVDRGLVKVGSKWLTQEEKAAVQEKVIGVADSARKLLREGRLNDAEKTLDQALTEDPQNVAALYLRGLLQYRQEQIQPARKTFETVNALLPNHAPTLNNLGVILFRQNQLPGALNFYDQAMLAAPQEKLVLNNVAEALYAMPQEQQLAAAVQKAGRHFTEQDTDLARKLAEQGLHRWGATWVTAQQLEQLEAAEREVRDKLDQLSADFDATKVRIANIDRDIEANERAMRRLEATSYVRDAYGNIYQTVLPSSYEELHRDSEKLGRERSEAYSKLDNLRAAARAVQQRLPVPKYTGIQRLIDVEGTPVLPPIQVPGAAPTTAPATQPTAHGV